MNWFSLFFIVMGIALAIIPDIVMGKVRQGTKLDGAMSGQKYNSASFWLFALAWAAIFTSWGIAVQLYLSQEVKIEKLERRIEVLEAVPKVDTIHINDIRLP